MDTDDPIPALKRQAAEELVKALDGSSLEYAAVTLKTNRYRIAEIRRGRLDRFSLEMLIRFLNAREARGRAARRRCSLRARNVKRSH